MATDADTLTILPVGGSEAAAAVGLNPYESQVELFLRKTGQIPAREATEAMGWGTALQPVIAAAVEGRGYVVLPAPADPVTDPDRPWMSGHPDGFVAEPPYEKHGSHSVITFNTSRGVLELKTASPFVHGWDRPEGPMHYELQVRHYLALTDLEWGLLACLVGGQRLELKRIERDSGIEEMLVGLEREFYDRCVSGDPPPPDGSKSAGDMLAALYPTARPETVVQVGADIAAARAEYRRLREQIGLLEKSKEEQAQKIKAALGEHEAAVYEGETIATWKNVSVKEQVRAARVDRRLYVP